METIMLESLNQTFQQSLARFWVLGLLIIISIPVCGIFIARDKKKNSRLSKRTEGLLTSICMLIVALILFAPGEIYAMKQDIKHKQIVEAYGYYTLDATSEPRRNWLVNGYVYVTIDGESMPLKLPAEWTYDCFPKGSYWGEIIYSKESHIILHFSPN